MSLRKTHRYKLLLDEMFPKRNRFPLLNNNHNLKHIVHDLKKPGIKDNQVVELARNETRIIITKNFRHFRSICKTYKVDLISVTESMQFELIDEQINAYLRKRRNHVMIGEEKKISMPSKR